MCQLTYSNLHDAYLNGIMVYFLSTIGSSRHDDGCGLIASDCKIWKTELAAEKITNLGHIINTYVIDDAPVPFHIRMATLGIEVKRENSHPFDGKHFILMHNGTLVPKSGEEPKDKKKDSDSLKFLKELDAARDANPNIKFEDIFRVAMEGFAGKFAFIIREKETKIDYIIRGRTAELWKSEIKQDDTKIGYVINTSDITLKEALHQFVNVASIGTGNDYSWSTPVLLKAETIFIAEKMSINEIGKAIEYTPVAKAESKTESAITPFVNHASRNRNNNNGSYASNEVGKILRLAEKIYDYLDSHAMTLLDLQIMFKLISGLSLLELTKEDLEMFVDYMIPKISANGNLRKQVKGILNGNNFPTELYKLHNLEYPWTVNEGSKILDALKEWKG